MKIETAFKLCTKVMKDLDYSIQSNEMHEAIKLTEKLCSAGCNKKEIEQALEQKFGGFVGMFR